MQWHTVAKAFHWLMALLIFAAIILGSLAVWWDSSDTATKGTLYSLHKSTGLTVLALGVLRLGWRLLSKRPPPLPTHSRWERVTSEGVHVVLYALLLLLPLSGWLLHSAATVKFPLTWFGLFPVPEIAPNSEDLQTIASWAHWLLFLVLAGLLALHIAGALKHHVLDRDITLQRMLPSHSKFWSNAWLALVLCVALATAGIGGFVWWSLENRQPNNGTDNLAPSAKTIATDNEPGGVATATQSNPVINNTGDIQRWNLLAGADNQLLFAVKVYGETIQGEFTDFTVQLSFDPNDLANSRVVTNIQMQAFDSGDASRDDMLPNQDWFAVQKFPLASFVATEFVADSSNTSQQQFIAKGTLTIRDQSQPLAIPFTWTPNEAGDQATISAIVSINRLNYDVGAGDWADPQTVAHDVQVRFKLVMAAE